MGLTFFVSRSVAQVCRKSWKRVLPGSPALEERLELARSEVAPVEGLARLGGEHEPVLLPQGASPVYFCELTSQVGSEGVHGTPGQADPAAAALGLWGGETGTTLFEAASASLTLLYTPLTTVLCSEVWTLHDCAEVARLDSG